MTESSVNWERVRQADIENAVTRRRLTAKAGFDDKNPRWNPAEWEQRLLPWEFHYMISDSFSALCNQGGLIHAFHCFFDSSTNSSAYIAESKVLEAWAALQSLELPKLYELARQELVRFGRERFEDLEPEEEEELEETLDEAWIGGGEPIEIRLADYAHINKGEQAASSNH